MSSKLRKVLIISGIVIALIILILAGGFFYLNRNVDQIAEDFLAKGYDNSELSGVYEISYDDISIGLLSGSFKISNLKISPKDSFYTAPDTLRLKYPMLFKIHVPDIEVTGIDENFSISLYKISLEEISITQPEITLIDHLTKAEKERAKAIKANQHEKTKPGEGKIKEVLLKAFEISNGRINFFDRTRQKEIVSAGTINLNTSDLRIEFGGEMEALISRTFKDTQFSIGNIDYPTPGGFYKIKVGEILNKSGNNDVLIMDFELIPQYDKLDFGREFGKQTDRMQLTLKEFTVKGFDLEKFLHDDQVFISQILVDGLFLSAFRDKNIPFDYSKFPKMPQQSLADLEIPLDIREIKINNSEVLYEQLGVEGSAPGQVPFKHINGTIRNVSNVTEQIEQFGPMAWELDANIFAEGQLHLLVEFTKYISQPDFTFSGTLKQMDMKAFNQMIEHTEYIRIDSGMIQSMSFEAVANSEFVEGELLMEYSNLKIAGLRHVSKKEKDELGLISAIANAIIRHFNPPRKHDGEPIKSKIFYVRDKNKGIFNYLAKGLISGIKSTILPSISSPKNRYEKKIEKEERKNAREQRKQERREQRDARKEDKGNKE